MEAVVESRSGWETTTGLALGRRRDRAGIAQHSRLQKSGLSPLFQMGESAGPKAIST